MMRLLSCLLGIALLSACVRLDAQTGGLGFALRLGGATTRTSGLLIGADLGIPSFALLPGFRSRVDADTWGQPTSGWDRSNGGRAVTLCQLQSALAGYYGVGAGYSRLRSRGETYEGLELKLVLGLQLIGAGVEANWHIGKISTWTGMLRFGF